MREYCNMTIGWVRGGGSNTFVPKQWPKIGATPVSGRRNTPWSYMMNVCTHSYSLVWYSWQDWEVRGPTLQFGTPAAVTTREPGVRYLRARGHARSS